MQLLPSGPGGGSASRRSGGGSANQGRPGQLRSCPAVIAAGPALHCRADPGDCAADGSAGTLRGDLRDRVTSGGGADRPGRRGLLRDAICRRMRPPPPPPPPAVSPRIDRNVA